MKTICFTISARLKVLRHQIIRQQTRRLVTYCRCARVTVAWVWNAASYRKSASFWTSWSVWKMKWWYSIIEKVKNNLWKALAKNKYKEDLLLTILTRTKQVGFTRWCWLTVRSSPSVKFFKRDGVLNAQQETAKEHVGVLRICFDLQGAHHDVS